MPSIATSITILLVVLLAIGFRLNEDSNREQARLVAKGAKIQRSLKKPSSYDRDAVMVLIQLRSPQDQARFQSQQEESLLRGILTSAVTKQIRPKVNGNSPVDMYVGDANRDRHVKTFKKALAIAGELSVQFPADVANNTELMKRKAEEVKQIVGRELAVGGFSTVRFPSTRVRVYVVRRSLYTEYGEYAGEATIGWDPKQTSASWLGGGKNDDADATPPASPYFGTVVTFRKPQRHQYLSNMVWAESVWWAIQSPMSEMMQPRGRYVRNVVLWRDSTAKEERMAEDEKDDFVFDAVVHEMWPSVKHADDLYLFFHANSAYELVINTLVMARSAFHFGDMFDFQGRAVNEYLFI